MAIAASDSATPALHSPRGGAALETPAAAAVHSPQHRRRGGTSSAPWSKTVSGPDLQSPPAAQMLSSPSVDQTAVASTSLLSPPPVSSGAEEQAVNGLSADRTPTEAAADTGYSTSILPDDAAGDAQPEGSDNGRGGGSNAAKKPVWNKPSNGGAEIGPVMGAESWPALSESTRAATKLSSTDIPKALPEVSLPAPQADVSKGTGVVLPSASKLAPTVPANSNSTPHHPHNHPRPLKRNTSNISSSNGILSQVPSSSPKGSLVETSHGNSGRPADNLLRENTRDGGQRPQSYSGSEHQQQRNSYRRGNGGSHPRGDGTHHHGYGGRRGDQDRGNQDWNPNRSFGGRDAQVQQHRVSARPFIRGPTPPPPQSFFPPPPLAMSVRPMVYPDMTPPVYFIQAAHPDPFRTLSVVPPQMPPVFFHGSDPQKQAEILHQIEYYFSNENLIKDTYLRQNMDDQGWVPIKVIADFKKIILLTKDAQDPIQLILDSVRTSSAVELEGEKVRRQNDWSKWLLPANVQLPVISSPRSDVLAANLRSFGLDDKTAKYGYTQPYLSPSSSGEWSSLSQQSSNDKAGAGFPLSAPTSSK